MANAEPQAAAPLLTAPQVAERLSLSEKTVRKRMASGELPVVRLGEGPKAPVRVSEDALRQYIEGHDELRKLAKRARLVGPLLALSRKDHIRRALAPKKRVRVRRKPAQTPIPE